MNEFHVHCSELVKWTGCEKSHVDQRANPGRRPQRPEHVATWIGHAVHALCAESAPPAPPAQMEYDGITPNLRHARRQIDRMALAVHGRLIDAGWRIDGHEVEMRPLPFPDLLPQLRLVGRIDLTGWWNGRGIVDVKTSKAIEAAWLQLGGYGLMHEAEKGRVEHLCTVHCPRVKLGAEQTRPTMHFCDPVEAMKEARRVVERISEILERDRPVASPGSLCSYCEHPTCVVRTGQTTPHHRRPHG